jgi:dihydropteroate synthase
MGVVNVTPDSFFPASRTALVGEALARGRRHRADGADVVDVGGESTRPGAEPVDHGEEMRRVLPVVEALAEEGPVSIDTYKADVARAALAAGATIVNDVGGTLYDVAAARGAGYVAMHRRGDARTMQVDPRYVDVVGEVLAFLDELAGRARAAGVGELWLDPGIGFGKTTDHNVALLAHVDDLVEVAARHDAGVLIGTSRKRFLGELAPTPLAVDDRLEGSIATEAWSMVHGVAMVRVHDVRAAAQLRDLLSRPVAERVR